MLVTAFISTVVTSTALRGYAAQPSGSCVVDDLLHLAQSAQRASVVIVATSAVVASNYRWSSWEGGVRAWRELTSYESASSGA